MTTATTNVSGRLDLRFVSDGGGLTRLAEKHQRFPLHMTASMFLDPAIPNMAFAYMQNPSGALFGDDRLHVSVALEKGAQVHLTTTSATKVHRTASGPARQQIDINLGPETLLEYLPDPIIPHAGSAYEQDTVLRADRRSIAILGEIIAPGRLARGEVFAFKHLLLRTRIEIDGREVCTDVLDLQPALGALERRGIFGAHRYAATLYVVCPSAYSAAVADRLDAIARDEADIFGAAVDLPENIGAFARILAPDPCAARAMLQSLWDATRQELLGVPAPQVRK